MRYTRVSLIALTFLLITALAACGGESGDPGGSGATTTSPPSQATPASLTEVSSTQASPTRGASTSSQASSSTATSTGAASSVPESTSSAPESTTPPEPPTAVPARVVAPGLVKSRPCEEEFRETLANYDGPERFDAKLVTSLSDEFVELRPDCLAQGWDPEFVQETQVCYDWEDNPNSIMEKGNRYDYISPTQWVVSKGRIGDLEGRTTIHINVHLYRFPLTSEIPSRMNYSPGELVGGCWSYKGWRGPDGQSYGWWGRSFFKYVLTSSGKAARNRVFSSGGKSSVVESSITSSYPGCDTLLQAALSEELDDGRAVNLAGVDELIEQVRVTAGVACAAEWATFLTWQPSPVDGPSAACPFGSSTGLQADGFFVVNWPDGHFDLYGDSACWVRSPEGEWGAYLSSEDGPPRPAARAVEEPPEPDRETLMALYRALGGNRWGSSFNEYWATDAPLDRWEGVRVKDGRVVSLELHGASLMGEIPREIAGLTALEHLDLGGHRLTGEIPPELGRLSNLSFLSLSNNQLTGEIPPELWGLSNLRTLNLNDNELTGRVPDEVANLTNLTILNLVGNGLTGCLPPGMQEHLDRNPYGYGLEFCN